MHHHRRTLVAAALLVALTACSSEPTYDESVEFCRKVLLERSESEKGKPKECEPLKQDDYVAVAAAVTVERLGWTDEDGNFDKNKMLEDTAND